MICCTATALVVPSKIPTAVKRTVFHSLTTDFQLEPNYMGVPREAAVKFVNMCSVCQNNVHHRIRTASASAASRQRVIRLSCITRDFNRRCQVGCRSQTQFRLLVQCFDQ